MLFFLLLGVLLLADDTGDDELLNTDVTYTTLGEQTRWIFTTVFSSGERPSESSSSEALTVTSTPSSFAARCNVLCCRFLCRNGRLLNAKVGRTMHKRERSDLLNAMIVVDIR